MNIRKLTPDPTRAVAQPHGIASRAGWTAQGVVYVFAVELALSRTTGFLGLLDVPASLLVWLAIAPVLWLVRRRLPARMATSSEPAMSPPAAPVGSERGRSRQIALLLGATVAFVSLATGLSIATRFQGCSSMFDNEDSNILQAETFVRGRLWFPSHPIMPELFDQMHVLNEGKRASRYFPGTALWMAPFVAIGHAHFGHCIANVLITVLIFATGRKLAGNLCGFVAGLVIALSPGTAIFGSLLLSSHPTALGLALFIFAFFRMQAAHSARWAMVAGSGLAFAILCRPLTAVAVAAPFAVAFGRGAFCWRRANTRPLAGPEVQRGQTPSRVALTFANGSVSATRVVVAVILPVAVAVLGILFYNRAITGSAWQSPWQLYNDIYTPRHVYGFNNGVRGDAARGPKVVTGYDRWAANLTVDRAVDNAGTRLVESWRWTLGVIPLAMAGGVVLFCPGQSRAGWLLLASIASLHMAYFPYWFVGTLRFHYVFESIPLWTLIFGLATTALFDAWRSEGRSLMPVWWLGLGALSLAIVYLPLPGQQASALETEISNLTARGAGRARFLRLVESAVSQKPALVLVEEGLANSYAVNSAALDAPVIIGRYRPSVHSPEQIARAFPDRAIYLFDQGEWRLERLRQTGGKVGPSR